MARYRGPKQKIARRFKEPIFGPSTALERKPYGPGQHGRSRFTRKSEYAVQLDEKQKAKYTYGLLEKQFRNTYEKATRQEGVTGEVLLQLLESRLDNVVFRLGFARTRRQARQLTSHKHIVVNGQVVNIPSYEVKPGDVISLRPKSKNLQLVTEALESYSTSKYKWLETDKKSRTGKFLNLPVMEEIPENINVQLIIELYSK
ncbi:30S ribosomal protein S4 [Rhodohalobacter sulfatireducens]|jgi:small subunit ribosomal protein S4|uniref:Small ribosomal subunit protein uS4 n=1 Tax=Rhodohalobacter sulfatireducens TaxID=2911366 RepID=A0ABS9KJF6_9BACT|nr:30S ribosomal protein S4 [Rhodohalobacter sulfatireducens]MCG2590969.1 30S ribosomal protein S4 [Rhodohalobacter sulfatireducens]MDR9366482.1 30S ribosomal protein S4 [Balneolaceae bacterium]MDR9409033.1 30S ribosomal protein S4 [Balneolaceae bacterium]